MLWWVSLVPTPATTWARSPTASSTARTRSVFSASLVVGDSPVGPLMIRPSCPGSTRCGGSPRAHQGGWEPLRAVEVECAVRREGRDHGGEDPPEGGLRSGGRSHG